MIRLPREEPPEVPDTTYRLSEEVRAAAGGLLGVSRETLLGRTEYDATTDSFRKRTLTETRDVLVHRAARRLKREPEEADIREELRQRTTATPEKKRVALLDGAYAILGTEDIEQHLRRTARSVFRTIDDEQHWQAEGNGPRIDFGKKLWRAGNAVEILTKLKKEAGATLQECGITIPTGCALMLKDGKTRLTNGMTITEENAKEILDILLATKAPIRNPAARLWAREQSTSLEIVAGGDTFRCTADMRAILRETIPPGGYGTRIASLNVNLLASEAIRGSLDDMLTLEERIGGGGWIRRDLQTLPYLQSKALFTTLFHNLGVNPDEPLAIRTDVTLEEALRERRAMQYLAELGEHADQTGNQPRARITLIAGDILARNPHLAKNMAGKALRRAMALEELAQGKFEQLAAPMNLRTSIDALGKITPPKLPDETPTKIWNAIQKRTGKKLRIDATGDEETKLTQWDTVLPIVTTVFDARGKDTKFAKAFEKLSGILPTDTFTKTTLATWLKGKDVKTIAHVIELAYKNAHGKDLQKKEEYEQQEEEVKKKVADAKKRTKAAYEEDTKKLQEQPDRACWRVIGAYLQEKNPTMTPRERRHHLWLLTRHMGLHEVGCTPQVLAEGAGNKELRTIGIHREVNLQSSRERDEVWTQAVHHFNRALGLWNEEDDTVARSITGFVARNSIIWIGCDMSDLWNKITLNRTSVPRLLAIHTRFRNLFAKGITLNERGKTRTFPFPRTPTFLLALQNLEEAIMKKVLLLSRHGRTRQLQEGDEKAIRLLVGAKPWEKTLSPHQVVLRAHQGLRDGFHSNEHFVDDSKDADGNDTYLGQLLSKAGDTPNINSLKELREQNEIMEPITETRRRDRWGRLLIPTRWAIWQKSFWKRYLP